MAKLIQFQSSFFQPQEVAQVAYDGRNVTIYTRSSPKVSEFRFPSAEQATRAALGFVASLEDINDPQNKILEALEAFEERTKERHKALMKTQAEIAQTLRDNLAVLNSVGEATAIAAAAATEAAASSNKSADEIKKLQKLIEDLNAAIAAGGNASTEVEEAAEALTAQIAIVAQKANTAKEASTAAQTASKAADDLVPDPVDPPPVVGA